MNRVALAVAFMVGCSVAVPAQASSFTVNPTQIFLSPKSTSALLTLTNASNETLRFQLTVFAWDQSAAGEMRLEKTNDIVFFPTLLTLAAGESRNVRVGATTTFAVAEKTYRIFVEELPPQSAFQNASSVRMLTRMGVPIFMQPGKNQAHGSVRALALNDGTFSFEVRNTGNVHFVPQRVKVRGVGAGGVVQFDKALDGWYILAGGRRAYELKLSAAECQNLAAITVEVQVGSSALKDRLETPSPPCLR